MCGNMGQSRPEKGRRKVRWGRDRPGHAGQLFGSPSAFAWNFCLMLSFYPSSLLAGKMEVLN